MDESETAEEHLKMQLEMSEDMGWKDPNALNLVVARNALHKDLGSFKERAHVYRLDDGARDRLLAHARQDAAHALSNTATLLDQIKTLRRAMLVLIALLILGFLSGAALILLFH